MTRMVMVYGKIWKNIGFFGLSITSLYPQKYTLKMVQLDKMIQQAKMVLLG